MEKTPVQQLGSYLSEIIATDQTVTRCILAVLLSRELERSGDGRWLSEQIHAAIDTYVIQNTPAHLLEADRQRARDLADRLLDIASGAMGKAP